MSLQAGQIIHGRYRVDQLIGAGSGAEVYKVYDLRRSATLALKLFRTELAHVPGFVESFRSEARALESLDHPNIVRFYDLVEENPLVFILVDYIQGQTLRKLIRQRNSPFDFPSISTILQAVCSALYYAHNQSIIHCDIKPENILIKQTGEVLLNDFGIAAISGADIKIPGVGTPAYMAPEQIRGEKVTPQTDIYALGVLLFELLTASKPFTGSRAPALLTEPGDRIRWEHENVIPPAPSSLNPQLSPSIDAIVLKCLEKDPRRRFSNALSLLREVQSIELTPVQQRSDLTPRRVAAVQKTPRPANRLMIQLIPLGIFLAVVLAVVGILSANPNQTLPTIVNPSKNQPAIYSYDSACMNIVVRLQPKTQLSECITSIQVQPDGSLKVAMEWRVDSSVQNSGVVVQADTNNQNMYLMDNLGNRLDHIATGGGTDQEVELFNGDVKQGWFLFPAPDPAASGFYFLDDDNGVRSPYLAR